MFSLTCFLKMKLKLLATWDFYLVSQSRFLPLMWFISRNIIMKTTSKITSEREDVLINLLFEQFAFIIIFI